MYGNLADAELQRDGHDLQHVGKSRTRWRSRDARSQFWPCRKYNALVTKRPTCLLCMIVGVAPVSHQRVLKCSSARSEF